MSINMNYRQFRTTMTEQRRRLRDMVKTVSDDLFDELANTYLPQLQIDVANEVPVGETGKLLNGGITYNLNRTSRNKVTLSVTAKAYSDSGYNYAYIQHENEDFSHEVGTHHFISGPFEKMIKDISEVEGFDYSEPEDEDSIFGAGIFDQGIKPLRSI